MVTTLVGDPEELVAHSSAWDARVLVRKRAPSPSRATHIELGSLAFEVVNLAASVTVTGAVTPGIVVITLPLRASGDWRLQGNVFGLRETQVIQPGREHVATTQAPVSFVSMGIPIGSLLERLELLDRGFVLGHANGIARLPPRTLRPLRSAVVAACGFAWQRSGDPAQAAQASLFVEGVIDAAAAAIVAWPSQRKAGRARLRRVEERIRHRLLEFFGDEPDTPIGVADLCATADCSERTLRVVFDRNFGTSPSRFLRLRRLDAARRALQRPFTRTTVTAVALDFGFADIGRFAGAYRKVFGELPSATLQRASGIREPADAGTVTP